MTPNRVFISTSGSGARRAEVDERGVWSVEAVLQGEQVHCFAADPYDRSVVYAGTQGKGVLRSTDGGKSWQAAGLDGEVVKAVAVSPTSRGMVYAGTRPARLFVSRDDGATWQELSAFRRIPSRRLWFSPADSPFTAYVQGIALSPTDPQVIVLGIEFGAVVRSGDGGTTWKDHRKGALRDCHSIKFHASNGDWVYEGGGTGAGAAFSHDAGVNWTQNREGLDRHYGWAVAADPARPDIWYVSLSPGPRKAHGSENAEAYIYRSTAGGAWEKLGGGLPQPLASMPYALLTDRDAPGSLYAGLSNGDVWFSADYGDHWQQLPVNMGAIRAVIMI
jgi:hypothetical protein